MIAYHASADPLVLADLVVGGSTGRGPSALGLWACDHVQDWQANYGGELARITLRADTRTFRTDTPSLCERAGSSASEAWAALGRELLADGHQVVLLGGGADEHSEIVVLDPAAIAAVDAVDWP